MAYRRTYRRKRPTYRRKRMYRARGGKRRYKQRRQLVPSVDRLSPLLLPHTVTRRLVWMSDQIISLQGSGSQTAQFHAFNLINPNNPDWRLGEGYPIGFKDYMLDYHYFQVLGTKTTVYFRNTATTPAAMIAGVTITESNQLAGLDSGSDEVPKHLIIGTTDSGKNQTLLNIGSAGNKKVVVKTSINKALGISNVISNLTVRGTYGTAIPRSQLWALVWAYGVSGSGTPGEVQADVQIEYLIRFSGPHTSQGRFGFDSDVGSPYANLDLPYGASGLDPSIFNETQPVG